MPSPKTAPDDPQRDAPPDDGLIEARRDMLWRNIDRSSEMAREVLALLHPLDTHRREETLAIVRILAVIQGAMGGNGSDALRSMGAIAGRGLTRRDIVLELRRSFRERAPLLRPFDLESHAQLLSDFFLRYMQQAWPWISPLLAGSEAEDGRALGKREDLRRKVAAALLAHLQRKGLEGDPRSEEQAGRLVIEAFIALGVARNKARELFRFEDQRAKREALSEGMAQNRKPKRDAQSPGKAGSQ